MKLRRWLMFFFLIILISGRSFSQKSIEPINYRFRNGGNGFYSFFIKNIEFPESSIKNGTIGNSITRISVNPKGELDSVAIINPVDSSIDSEVLRVISLSKRLWKECDSLNSDQVFYVQIAFSLSGYQPNIFRPKSKRLKNLFIEPIVIKIPESLLDKESKDSISFIKSSILSEKLNSCLKEERFEAALPLIHELIGRDPFNRDLYKTRIMINTKLNRPELIDQDDNKIFDFAEGFTIDDLNIDRQ
jgi:hypothetical protein